MSIQEFHNKSREEDDDSKLTMHGFLHKDSQHRLGSRSTIKQIESGVYKLPDQSWRGLL